MNRFPAKETVSRVKETYPSGCRVELIHMNDPYTKLNLGDQGTVKFGVFLKSWG